MTDSIKKLRFKGDAIVLHAPAGIGKEFLNAGFKTTFEKGTKSQNTLVFVTNNNELMQFLKKDLQQVEPDSVLWIAYPKGTSKIKTDINRDTIREAAEGFGITTVTAIAIDETWSGLRFRPLDRVGK